MIRIAVIIVTYNRKDLLAKCLDAIKKGEMQPSAIYIVDNNSHDGTHDMLQSKGYLNDENIIYQYGRKPWRSRWLLHRYEGCP